MGQYFDVANLDSRETISHYDFGCGAKATEQVGSSRAFPAAIYFLLAQPERPSPAPSLGGLWAGDRIVLIGDYASDSDLPKEFKASSLYSRLQYDAADPNAVAAYISDCLENGETVAPNTALQDLFHYISQNLVHELQLRFEQCWVGEDWKICLEIAKLPGYEFCRPAIIQSKNSEPTKVVSIGGELFRLDTVIQSVTNHQFTDAQLYHRAPLPKIRMNQRPIALEEVTFIDPAPPSTAHPYVLYNHDRDQYVHPFGLGDHADLDSQVNNSLPGGLPCALHMLIATSAGSGGGDYHRSACIGRWGGDRIGAYPLTQELQAHATDITDNVRKALAEELDIIYGQLPTGDYCRARNHTTINL